jgi:ribosome-binding factor A
VSERTRRVDQLLREEISTVLRRELHDPRVGFVTITSVDVTPDLRHATVWVSVIGDATERKASLQVLGRAMPFVRHQLGALRLRRIPELHLREDDSAQRGTRVMRLLDEISAEASGSADAGDLADLADAALEAPGLPTPRSPNDPGASGPDGALDPLPAGYRRRVDRVALRKARQRRGR